jgi:hypothetical protein
VLNVLFNFVRVGKVICQTNIVIKKCVKVPCDKMDKWVSNSCTLANVRPPMITCLMSTECEVLRELGFKGSLCDHEGCFNTRRVDIWG